MSRHDELLAKIAAAESPHEVRVWQVSALEDALQAIAEATRSLDIDAATCRGFLAIAAANRRLVQLLNRQGGVS